MPTYDYECGKCGKVFEVFQKMSARPITKCPKCRGKSSRLIGAGSGVIFKGSGFYQTDYKNPSSRLHDSIPSEARDKNKKRSKDTEKKACPNAKSDGCKSCPMSKKERD